MSAIELPSKTNPHQKRIGRRILGIVLFRFIMNEAELIFAKLNLVSKCLTQFRCWSQINARTKADSFNKFCEISRSEDQLWFDEAPCYETSPPGKVFAELAWPNMGGGGDVTTREH